ncbi:MAG: pyridoxamine 5'-phosphate oxidase [Rudaea sp.]
MSSLYEEAIAAVAGLFDAARAAGEPEPAAMTLATAAIDGRVSARIVLLKQIDVRGFAFYTNYDSAKAHQLEENSSAAVCILWKTLNDIVQVRAEGVVGKVAAAESDAYFASRIRPSQIGAWASRQSQTLASRAELDARVAEFERKFDGVPVPRPPHWGGYCLVPEMIELWYGQRARLHERVCYEIVDGAWSKRLLYP